MAGGSLMIITRASLDAAGFPLVGKYLPGLRNEAKHLAQKYAVPYDYEDILQLILTEATRLEEKFDNSFENSFMTYIRKPIRQRVKKHYGYNPAESKKVAVILKFMRDYELEHKVLPDIDIIANSLGVTKTALKALYFDRPSKVSFDDLEESIWLENDETLEQGVVAQLMEALTEEEEQLFLAFHIEGYTIKELAVLHERSAEWVALELERIRKYLKEKA